MIRGTELAKAELLSRCVISLKARWPFRNVTIEARDKGLHRQYSPVPAQNGLREREMCPNPTQRGILVRCHSVHQKAHPIFLRIHHLLIQRLLNLLVFLAIRVEVQIFIQCSRKDVTFSNSFFRQISIFSPEISFYDIEHTTS